MKHWSHYGEVRHEIGRVKEENLELEFGCYVLYTRLNIEILTG
jgi:hypothetical protein